MQAAPPRTPLNVCAQGVPHARRRTRAARAHVAAPSACADCAIRRSAAALPSAPQGARRRDAVQLKSHAGTSGEQQPGAAAPSAAADGAPDEDAQVPPAQQHQLEPPPPLPSAPVAVALALLGFYRREISPLLPRSCRFVPSCSEYSVEAFKAYGFWRGGLLTAWRLARCNPLNPAFGYDPPRWPPRFGRSEEQ
jgi:putative membrane protein insertion efficiency factor